MISLNSRELLLAGGWDNICVLYSISDNSWSQVNNPSRPRRDPALTQYHERVVIMGGYTGCHELDTVEEYDEDKREWKMHSMSLPRSMWYCVAGVMDLPVDTK
ncbi:MAG: hypothetical protein GY701_07950 [Sulfitobacter sp.]|nr:hypothetical protein [Sulfitobacter sp.]